MQDFLWTSFIPFLKVRKNVEIWISFNSSKLLYLFVYFYFVLLFSILLNFCPVIYAYVLSPSFPSQAHSVLITLMCLPRIE